MRQNYEEQTIGTSQATTNVAVSSDWVDAGGETDFVVTLTAANAIGTKIPQSARAIEVSHDGVTASAKFPVPAIALQSDNDLGTEKVIVVHAVASSGAGAGAPIATKFVRLTVTPTSTVGNVTFATQTFKR